MSKIKMKCDGTKRRLLQPSEDAYGEEMHDCVVRSTVCFGVGLSSMKESVC